MQQPQTNFPQRPAWIEVDLGHTRRNLQTIRRNLPSHVKFLAVVKDDAYGHGAVDIARIALEEGAWGLGLSNVEEATELRDAGITAPLLVHGERHESELEWCVARNLTVCVNDTHNVRALARFAAKFNQRIPVHLKVNTGMSRYGVRWDEAGPLMEQIIAEKSLELEGVMTHFAQSDEIDKTFADAQFERFSQVLRLLEHAKVHVKLRHSCNSGGFLDLPHAHLDMVRTGILLHGIFPSTACRKIPGIEPVMTVKTRIAAVQKLNPGEVVGYGMHFKASTPRRVAVLPIGYGDGYPRIRNVGHALIHGHRAPIVGGVTMDAFFVDVTEIPGAKMWDEAVVMGRQGNEEINARDIAGWKNGGTYEILTNWRIRLRKEIINGVNTNSREHARIETARI
jgi:alanine racemase